MQQKTKSNEKQKSGKKATTPHGQGVPIARKKIREAILCGDLAPGTAIREEELAKKLDVGRTPLRVALALLEDEGLVRKLTNSATIVLEPKGEEVSESVTLRYLIESMVVTVLASKSSEKQLFRIEEVVEIQDEMRRLIDSSVRNFGPDAILPRTCVDDFLELDMQFHSKLAELAGFPWAGGHLRELRQRVLIYLFRNAQQIFRPDRVEITLTHHQLILDKIMLGKAKEARDEVYKHLTEVAKRWYPQILPSLEKLNEQLGLSRAKPHVQP
jgi:DNA-binding GntR family transcriptional regulator